MKALLLRRQVFSQRLLDEGLEAAELMDKQGIPVSRNYIYCLIQDCEKGKDLTHGRRVQSLMLLNGLDAISVLGDHLIRFFAYFGNLCEVNDVFKGIIRPTKHTWAAVISAHAKVGQDGFVFQLYHRVQHLGIQGDKYIYIAILKACTMTKDLQQGRYVHNQVITAELQPEVVLGSTLVDMYSKCGNLEEAIKVFDVLHTRNVVAWNAMIVGYAQNGQSLLALKCFEKMQKDDTNADEITFSGILKACASIGAIEYGRFIHEKLLENEVELDFFLESSLISMYAKSGYLGEACNVLFRLSSRCVVSWNAMISGYIQHGEYSLALDCFEKMQREGIKPNVSSWNAIITGYTLQGENLRALESFHKMQEEGIRPNAVTYPSVLQACADLRRIEQGRVMHIEVINYGLESDVVVGSALVDMYAKCGSLEEGCKAFYNLSNRNVVSWNAMIAGYAQHGEGLLALGCFHKMQEEATKPDEASYASALIACSRVGLMKEGLWYFKNMRENHGITPTVAHFTSMIDLLGRAGCLEAAENLLRATLQMDIMAWMSLFNACKLHGNLNLGRKCFDEIARLDSGCAAGYVLMLNIYCEMGIQE